MACLFVNSRREEGRTLRVSLSHRVSWQTPQPTELGFVILDKLSPRDTTAFWRKSLYLVGGLH